MIIAVNTRLRKDEQPEGYADLLFDILDRLTLKNPQHRFIYISDKAFDGNRSFADNVVPVITGPETGSSLRLQYWFNYRVPAVLRKHRADVFVSMEGIISLRTKKPQCLLVTDCSFLQGPLPGKYPLAGFKKKYTPAFLAKAKTVAAVSEQAKAMLVDAYKMDEAAVTVIKPGIDGIFKPLDWEEKEYTKEKYAGGKAYFLFSGDVSHNSNTINLLKAFTLFKKRQKSNMLLLIAGNAGEAFKKELKTYTFRNEVKLLEGLPKKELANIAAAAYAMVYPVLYSELALPVLKSMHCGVPVICSNTGCLPSIFGNAALYTDPGDIKEIAENMMLVFKDEDKAKALVQAGNTLAREYRWDKAVDLLMLSIQKAGNN